MPVLDMPLKELYKYEGSSPCPKDIDEYWDDALSEMESIDPKVEFVKKEFRTKTGDLYDLYFTSVKGARIHARFAKPKNTAGKVPALLHFHGLGGACLDWNDMVRYTGEGFAIAAMDVRGQGGTSMDVGGVAGTTNTTPFVRGLDGKKHDLLVRDMFLDDAMLAKIVMGLDYVDETRVAAMGGSQGGGQAFACACLVPEIKKCCVHYPYLSDYKRVYDMDLNKDAYEGLRYYFRNFDPTHAREAEIFERLGYIDIQNIAKRMKAELLMFTGLVDNICPPSTQFAAYNKVTSKKNVIIYPEYGHEGMKGSGDIAFEFVMDV